MIRNMVKIRKWMLLSFLFFLLACMTRLQPVNAAPKAARAKKAYHQMLSAGTLDWGDNFYPTDQMTFFCRDMNGDRVPELIVHYDGAFGYEGSERIYTYYKRKVRRIFMSGNCQHVTKYCKKKKIFIEEGGRMGWTLRRYYRLSGKRAVLLAQEQKPAPYMALSYGTIYRVKGKRVSRFVYRKYVRKQLGRAKVFKVRWFANTEENRWKYLS